MLLIWVCVGSRQDEELLGIPRYLKAKGQGYLHGSRPPSVCDDGVHTEGTLWWQSLLCLELHQQSIQVPWDDFFYIPKGGSKVNVKNSTRARSLRFATERNGDGAVGREPAAKRQCTELASKAQMLA